ncbi:MAG: hypothetical protein AAFU79_23235, partial [Myxococcota bacterium]
MKHQKLTLVGLGLLCGCGVGHVGDYDPKQRAYEPPADCVAEEQALEPGQLYTPRAKDFYRDIRAYQI